MTEIINVSSSCFDFSIDDACVTMGFFDGLHIGHRRLITDVVSFAGARGLPSCVFTYRNHPMTVLSPEQSPQLLSLPEERFALMSEIGPDYIIVNEFTHSFANVSAEDFISEILIKKLRAKYIAIGANHRFGRYAEGNPELLLSYNMSVNVVSPIFFNGSRVSSSAVRRAVYEGNMKSVSSMLGRPYGFDFTRTADSPELFVIDGRRALPPDGEYFGTLNGVECEFEFFVLRQSGSLNKIIVSLKSPVINPSAFRISASFLSCLRIFSDELGVLVYE